MSRVGNSAFLPPLPPPLPRNGIWHTYTTADGLAALRVEHVVQDGAGNMWFCTAASGLSRFDGSTWHTYTTADGLAGNQVIRGLASNTGDVWFGTWDRGLCMWDGTGFRRPGDAAVAGRPVTSLFEDGEGRIWFAGRQNLGYWDGRVLVDLLPECRQCYPAGFVKCWGIVEDGGGRIWFGTEVGLLVYEDGGFRLDFSRDLPGRKWRLFPLPIAGDGHGGVWACAQSNIYHSDGDGFAPVFSEDAPDYYLETAHRSAQIDAEGRLWICTSDGVCYVDAGGLRHFTSREGISYPTCVSAVSDIEGRIWIATWGGGVSCYDPHRVQTGRPPPQNRDSGNSQTIAACAGTVWLGNTGHLDRDLIASWDGGGFRFLEAARDRCNCQCSAIARAADGALYFGTQGGLLRYCDSALEQIDIPGVERDLSVTALCCDRDGGVFYGLSPLPESTRVLVYHYDGEISRQLFNADMAPDLVNVTCLALDRQGVLWAGISNQFGYSARSGLVRLGEEVRWFTAEDGLVDGRVQDLLCDCGGRLWIAMIGGLSWFDGERFHSSTIRDGLINNNLLNLCQDGEGRIWCATEAGLSVFDGNLFPTMRVPDIDPVRAATVDREGRIWCATTAGGVVRYRPGTRPPGVEVGRVIADRIYEPPDGVEDDEGSDPDDVDGVGTATAAVRAQRDGKGDGREYTITFTASDGVETVEGMVVVTVPHDQGERTKTKKGKAKPVAGVEASSWGTIKESVK